MQEVNYFLSLCPTIISEKDSPTYHIKLHSFLTLPFLTRPIRELEAQAMWTDGVDWLRGKPTDLS